MLRRFRLFVRGLATNWIGTLGVVLTTSAFLLFLFMEAMRLLGVVTNAYVGLISYLLLPALFILGLLLIPAGWRIYRRRTGRPTRELLSERFTPSLTEGKRAYGSSLVGLIAVLTLVNLLFLAGGGARMLHFMDEPVFCGTACHKVMHPEWETYRRSPHAHVKCVECHVGEGVDALVDAKLNGLWQMVSATFNLYERPIPTPVVNLRPARETCEQCHWPEKFYGDRLRVNPGYAFDRASTPHYSTLALKVGSGTGEHSGTIHWHIAAANEVRYQPASEDRTVMRWVEVRDPRGGYRRYENRRLPAASGEDVRVLDCIDCHNRATHIYEDPEEAVEARIAAGALVRALPYIKREGLAALTGSYADKAAARRGVFNHLQGTYGRQYRAATASLQEELDTAVAVLQATYDRNIHPRMHVDWNPYPDHRGHRNGLGCFRCHNRDMVDEQGEAVSHECTLCHSILAFESPEPFQFLLPVAEKARDRRMHEYLQAEFLRGRR